MEYLLYQAISLLPTIAITGIVAYFYIRTKDTGMLVMLIAYSILTVVTASSYYLPMYVADRALSSIEMQRLYTYIGIVSLVAQTLLAVGLAVVLSRYPVVKKDSFDYNNTGL